MLLSIVSCSYCTLRYVNSIHPAPSINFILPFFPTFKRSQWLMGEGQNGKKNFLGIGDGDVGRGALMDWGKYAAMHSDRTRRSRLPNNPRSLSLAKQIKKFEKKKSWTPLFSPSCRQTKKIQKKKNSGRHSLQVADLQKYKPTLSFISPQKFSLSPKCYSLPP